MALSRAACERRVYRLATLLTGDPVAAVRVITAVVDSQPDLRRLDSVRLDRLAVLRCRELPTAVLPAGALAPDAAASLAGLPFQAREAWLLHRVYRLPLRETARAMDCSVTATTRHLQKADEMMAAGLREAAPAAAGALAAWASGLDLPDFYRDARRRRDQRRRIALLAALVAAILALMWIVDRLSPG